MIETVDLARLLLDLLIVIVAARLAAELAERLGVPAVLGEIVAGIVVGPSVLGLVEVGGERGVSLGVLAEIGVLLLLVQVGMEMDMAELGRVGRASMLVAVIGVAAPFAAGAVAGIGLGFDPATAIFLGAALTATSVGITARVFGDLRALATVEARIVLGAAIADDVLGLIILTVVVKVVAGDAVSVGLVASTVAVALAFLAVSGIAGAVAVPRLLAAIARRSRSETTLTITALAIVLGLALLADAAQLAFIIGAFMAGLAVGRSGHRERIADDVDSLAAVFIPIFFVLIGVHADLGAMLRPSVLADAAVLFAIAVAGKLLSAMGSAGTRSDRLVIGLGMIPRGEVGLIFASIGLAQGVLDEELYGALLLVILLTTVMTPPLLRWRIGAGAAGAGSPSDLDRDVTPEPPGGWVSLRDGRIVLDGRPPASAVVIVALQAARLAGQGPPDDALLSWFGERRDVAVAWTADDTTTLLGLLRRGNPRALRLLEVTGVLERGVPTVAAAVARRRADPSELDPGRVLRFPIVTRFHELSEGAVDDAETLDGARDRAQVLAALVLDVLGLDADAGAIRRLLDELAVDDVAGVEHVLSSALMLRAAANDLDGHDRAELMQLAARVASVLEPAHLVAEAATIDAGRSQRLDQLTELLAGVVAHPDLFGGDGDSLATVRRQAAMAMVADGGARLRLQAAPDDHILAHEPDELARQAQLVEPLPAKGTVRVAVSPEGTPDHWVIDVAGRDRRGLLARIARALTAAGCDIAAARVATWPDGAAVDSFLVRSAVRPGARRVAEQIESALGKPAPVESLPDLDVRFDNDAAPWHTTCNVSGRDRPGALAALAAAFAGAGVVVHSARVTTIDGRLVDRFALSDRLGRKLDPPAMARVEAAIAGRPMRRARFAARPLIGA